ncbi:hypothetical protein [Aldersonia kunmingensis]|uniref:hypothetical protein n=1 Tax=Aldersonia kunmingensis TaxID=408066 RepID=UPI000829BF11|nr:hypothetical protein [Aldersonia kunmingensis]
MKFSRITVTAAMAITAVAVATGTASADPAPAVPADSAAVTAPGYLGNDHGINYRTFLNDAGRAITTTIDAGMFTLAGDAVTLTDRFGAVVASIPLAYEFAGHRVSVAPLIADAGRTLTVTPQVGTTDAALKNVDANWFFAELNRAAPGAAVGALIGGAIGLLGFIVGVIPGAIIGALVGLVVVGGQPLIDSAFSAFR